MVGTVVGRCRCRTARVLHERSSVELEYRDRRMLRSVTCNYSGGAVRPHKRHFTFSLGSKSTYVKLLLPRQGDSAKLKCNVGLPRFTRGGASGGLLLGLAVCCSNSKPVQAEAADDKGNKGNNDESADAKFAHGKRVYTDYSITVVVRVDNCSIPVQGYREMGDVYSGLLFMGLVGKWASQLPMRVFKES
ncbi:hypothetical protein CRG98_007393 [Punica granatum]|uniref:Uncharacterized protein n=1 Tax=Punica granatum TaxID=22663 RepID=A0A2I0KUP9_PUNGR|nr:hypothetical protein CRG98_007393 [Punica granatum]